MNRVRITAVAAGLTVAMVVGVLAGGALSTAQAEVATRTTTLGAVQHERDVQDAAREAARNVILAAGCEFHPDPNVVVPPQLRRASDAYFWVMRDCLTKVEAYAEVCEPVRPGRVGEGRAGWLLVTAECEIPTPAARVAPSTPESVECSIDGCEIEVVFRDTEGDIVKTMTLALSDPDSQ